MYFVSLFMAWGAAAASVPVIIHLLNRSRFKVVKWGAMHLLENVVRKNRKRVRIEQLLLLLVRMAIPALLAFCMAGPVLTGCRELAGDRPSSLMLLLDNSYSMEAGGAQRTNYQQLKEDAVNILTNLPKRSDVGVLMMGEGPEPLLEGTTYNVGRVAEAVKKTTPGYGSADPVGSLQAALKMLGTMKNPKHDVVLMTDFQKVDWDQTSAGGRAAVAEQIKQMSPKPGLVLYHVGKPVNDNMAVESVELSRFVVGVQSRFTIRANLKNYGAVSYSDLRVYLRVDGQERAAVQTPLDAHEQRQLLFTHAFDTPGSHFLEVYADADGLKADKSFLVAVQVWDRVPVLLVSGDTNPEPMRSETAFLEIALSPYSAGRGKLSDLMETRTIVPAALNAKLLRESRVVVLANVNQLDEGQTKDLEQYVKEGGTVVVFPGDRINIPWYNSRLLGDGTGLLPARIGVLSGSLQDHTHQTAILSQRYDHPAIDYFNDPRNGSLSDGQIWLWYRLDERASVPPDRSRGAEASAPTVIARLESGDPFLVEKKVGEGLVILAAVPCDGDWSNLPVRRFYLPLMQQLMTYAASKVYPPRNVNVNQALTAYYPAALAGQNAVLVDPEGARHDVPLVERGGRAVAEYDHTRRPGLYVLEGPDKSLTHFVANTSRRESDIAQLSEPEIAKVGSALGATVVRSWEEYRNLDRGERYGREIWPWVFTAVLLLLVGEMALQQYFARRKAA